MLDKLDGFDGRSTLKTWVCGILVNKARRHGVREARTLPFSSDGTTGTWSDRRCGGTTPRGPARKELRRVIDAAIAGLPTRQREVTADILEEPPRLMSPAGERS